MGWLRNLMQSAEPPYRSYGQLAQAALRHRDWPLHTRPRPRSLASIFSKIDRGIDSQWLADRAEVQRVLAELLRCPAGDVLGYVERQGSESDAALGRVRLEDLRFARTLQLRDEPLCPGVPAVVLRPAWWGACWWYAPSGAGRSLAGKWLEARGQASFICTESWARAKAHWPRPGATFIELLDRDDAAEYLPPGPGPVCVAAPFIPPAVSSSWRLIESPPVLDYLDELVDWVAARLPADGHFDPAFAKSWLRDGPAAKLGVVDRLGAALGLCGLLDELGTRAVRGRSLHELSRRYFERSVTETHEHADVAWLKRAGYRTLVGIFKRLLTDSHVPWTQPRSFEEWLRMVPVEHREGADVEWLRLMLLDGSTPLRESDIERAARRLPPGAYRVVRALRRARLLVPAPSTAQLALRPLWFGSSLATEAELALVDGSPFEWGEALLHAHAARGVARALQSRLEHGDAGPVEQVLEFDADDSPTQVAALETTFCTVGLLVLGGLELPAEQLEALWNEQLRLLVQLPHDPPKPRIAGSDPSTRPQEHAAWLLAAWAMTEQLPAGVGRRHPLLRPWLASSPPLALRGVFDRVYAGAIAGDAPWAPSAFVLADRLRSTIGNLEPVSLHPLERPGAVLEEVVHGVLTWETLGPMGKHPCELVALGQLAEQHQLPWPQVAKAIWAAWLQAGAPNDLRLLAPDSPDPTRFWAYVPAAALSHLLAHGGDQPQVQLPYGRLSQDGWQGVVQHLSEAPEASLNCVALWEALPAELLLQACEQVAVSRAEVSRVLWTRFAELLPTVFERWLGAGRLSQALTLLEATPDQHTPHMLSRLEPLLDAAPAELMAGVRRWLYERVARRGANWLAAYALLSSVEHELARVVPAAR